MYPIKLKIEQGEICNLAFDATTIVAGVRLNAGTSVNPFVSAYYSGDSHSRLNIPILK
jgi:hypothetical protein